MAVPKDVLMADSLARSLVASRVYWSVVRLADTSVEAKVALTAYYLAGALV